MRACGIALLALVFACQPALRRYEMEQAAMGTTFRLVLYARDGEEAREAAGAAFARVEELERIFSDYDPASESRRLAARAPVEDAVSPELLELTRLALELSERTGGAFDVTVGPLTALWRRALRRGEPPDPRALAEARAAVGARLVAADPERGTLALEAPGMRLDYGGIAKGYALDEALRALRARGVRRALVDGGGDVACGAPPPGRAGWIVAIEDPGGGATAAVLLRDAALATSADLARGGVVEGRALSHLVDPRTGAPVAAEPRAASVLAASGALADALASALLVMPWDEGERVVQSLGAAARLARAGADGAREVRTTAGFPPLVSSSALPRPPASKEPLR